MAQNKRMEKQALFKRFRYQPLINKAKRQLFDLFSNSCFKCGSTEKRLHIDHHIPYIQGGKLEPGNIVILCRSCNSRKARKSPHEFYSEEELLTLHPLLESQKEIFEFNWNWKAWNKDPQAYLETCGVPREEAYEFLTPLREPSTSAVRLSIPFEHFEKLKKAD